MTFNFKADILEYIEQNRIKISVLAKESGVKRDRIDQWKAGNGQPKGDDSEKLQKWKAGKMVAKHKNDDQVVNLLSSSELIEPDNQDIRKLNLTVNALHKSIEGYKATLLVLQEFVIRRVVAKDKIPREAVWKEMDNLLVELKTKNPGWDTHIGLDTGDSSVE